MNKKAIYLIIIFILVATLQIACSFSDILGNLGQGESQSGSQGNLPSQDGEDQGDFTNDESGEETSSSSANQSGCTSTFTGNSNIPDGSEYQAGDAVEASLILSNTGTCTWNTAYSLVMVGGDLMPSSADQSIVGEVYPGDSISVAVEFIAPSQDGVYLAAWKMVDGQGGVFGLENTLNAPLKIKIRVVSAGNSQPTSSPTPNSQASGDQFTVLENECFDFNTDSVVDCTDSSADFKYTPNHPLGGQLTRAYDNTFGENHTSSPDLNTCQNDSYIPLPRVIQEDQYLCFKIETLASTAYGWMRVTHYNENGFTFDFDLLGSSTPLVTVVPNTSLFVESQGQQITLMEGECYNVWDGELNSSCGGIFAGFLFEEVTKKSMQVSQISPNDMYFSAAMSSAPTKSECMNASYNTTPIWPIQSTSYYCYQFVPGTIAYYGWLRPTSFNLSGLTFDFLTWESSP